MNQMLDVNKQHAAREILATRVKLTTYINVTSQTDDYIHLLKKIWVTNKFLRTKENMVL